jgi:asparagine synthase (glutamine-hydrolysing)
MAAIAGIALPNAEHTVNKMLEKMAHRGSYRSAVKTMDGVTLGLCWPVSQPDAGQALANGTAEDRVSDSHYASAWTKQGSLVLTRDPLGVSPLYYGYNKENALCVTSEVKGLLGHVEEVQELPPGSRLEDGTIQTDFQLSLQEPLEDQRLSIAANLRRRLEKSVAKRARRGVPFGAWLSGGIDSSVLAALARPHIDILHTFAAGFAGAEDLEYARLVARHIQSKHHEMIPTFMEIVQVIPEVIFHLESFDALLVRSSLMNYLVAKLASDYVPAVFSGEGGDELFAGYTYLKQLSLENLPGELIDITQRLHNTALQRVDRCASAHGTVAYVGFLDGEVVDYALRIPAEYKIFNGLEKWILRRAAFDLLPERVALRKKAKFWEGAGVEENIARYAAERVTDDDFRQERQLPGGHTLNTKEELFYYRIFQEHFGSLLNIEWMGRTKGSPIG